MRANSLSESGRIAQTNLDRMSEARERVLAREWRSIRSLISNPDLSSRARRDWFMRKTAKLKTMDSYDCFRATELLMKKRMPVLALKLIESGRKAGERHPLLDYHRVRALWGIGRRNQALSEAKKAADKWNFSTNMAVLVYLSLCLGRQDLGDRWLNRAKRRATKELANESLFKFKGARVATERGFKSF